MFASTSANEDVFKKYCKTLQTQFSEEEEEEMELIRNSRKMTHFERQNSVVESEN